MDKSTRALKTLNGVLGAALLIPLVAGATRATSVLREGSPAVKVVPLETSAAFGRRLDEELRQMRSRIRRRGILKPHDVGEYDPRLLIARGAETQTTDDASKPTLDYEEEEGPPEMVRLLEASGRGQERGRE